MSLPELPETFWRSHPLEDFGAAKLMYTSILSMRMGDEMDAIYEMLAPDLAQSRQENINAVDDVLDKISTASEMISFLRHEHELVVEHTICRRALEMKEELMPLLLRRYRTSALDYFIETAALIFYHSHLEYLEQLWDMYHDIRSPYAQAAACLVLGLRGDEEIVPFLLKEYERLRQSYPGESYAQSPLLALYFLYQKL